MPNSFTEQVAATVRAELARHDRTQQDLAHALGLSQQSVSRRLSGQLALDTNEIQAIAEFLGIPVGVLVPAPVTGAA
jgi:transcriptional regulator with XRE-family HTH domain